MSIVRKLIDIKLEVRLIFFAYTSTFSSSLYISPLSLSFSLSLASLSLLSPLLTFAIGMEKIRKPDILGFIWLCCMFMGKKK